MFSQNYRDQEEKHVEVDEDEDLVAKAERDFFSVIEAEKKLLDQKEAKHRPVLIGVIEESENEGSAENPLNEVRSTLPHSF